MVYCQVQGRFLGIDFSMGCKKPTLKSILASNEQPQKILLHSLAVNFAMPALIGFFLDIVSQEPFDALLLILVTLRVILQGLPLWHLIAILIGILT